VSGPASESDSGLESSDAQICSLHAHALFARSFQQGLSTFSCDEFGGVSVTMARHKTAQVEMKGGRVSGHALQLDTVTPTGPLAGEAVPPVV